MTIRVLTDGTFYDREDGREITGPFVNGVMIPMPESVQCSERGVVETADGTLYTVTVRRPGHGDVIAVRGAELCRIATEWHVWGSKLGSVFGDVARGLLEFEREYVDPARLSQYRTFLGKY